MAKLRQWLTNLKREFDLLPDYLPLVLTRWQALLWGGTVLAALWGLHFILGEWPTWINWTAILVALFFAGYYVWRADHVRLIPRLGVRQVRQQPTPTRDAIGNIIGSSVYIQIEPECLTDAPVYNCEGKLLRVQKRINSHWEETEWNETAVLEWSQEVNQSPITINPGIPKRLNIFSMHSRNNWQITPCVLPHQYPLRAASLFAAESQKPKITAFRFHIAIVCQDRPGDSGVSLKPLNVCLEVELGNDPSSPHVELVAAVHERAAQPEDCEQER